MTQRLMFTLREVTYFVMSPNKGRDREVKKEVDATLMIDQLYLNNEGEFHTT